jgi:cytochrome c oxidase assembly protein subunit 15
VLGGLVVLFGLYPPLVMGHFVVSMLLLLDATVLHHRAGLRDGVGTVPVVAHEHLVLGRLVIAAAAVAILLGTVVTGSGPHAGSHDGALVARLPFAVGDVARIHSVSVLVFGAITLFLVRALRVDGAPPRLVHRAESLLVVLVAQGAVGYAQYFLGVPAILVAVHVLGAVAVWVAVIRLVLGMRVAAPAETQVPAVAGG